MENINDELNLNTIVELANKYKEQYKLNYLETFNEEIIEFIYNKNNANQCVSMFEEEKNNINFINLIKSYKYFPMVLLGFPTTTFILGNLYVLYMKKKTEKISNFLNSNKILIENLWKILQQNFNKIIEQYLFNNKNNINSNNTQLSIYKKEQIKEMSYYFQYKCLENTHLIKEKNFNLYNILLIGKTNVGKSTLINEFLNINKENENFAEEGTGCPTPTIDFKEYFGKRNETKYVLYDTNGIQLGGENSIENSLKKFENGIKENLINCIWYCISGSCIEDQEKNLIKKLINIYSEKEILPVLIIHTKTYDEDESNLVKNELLKDENLKNKLAYLPILARKKVIGKKINKYEIDSFGLDELENSTKEEIMNKSRNSALLAKLRDIYELLIY